MNDEKYREYADTLIDGADGEILSAVERDARRYNKAFEEEEEASIS